MLTSRKGLILSIDTLLGIDLGLYEERIRNAQIAVFCRETDLHSHRIADGLNQICRNLHLVSDPLEYMHHIRSGHWDMIVNTDYTDRGDSGILSAVAEAAGQHITGNSWQAVGYMWDKHVTKQILNSQSILTPLGVRCDLRVPAWRDNLVTLLRKTGTQYPLIVKPASSFGSYGVSMITSEDELVEAARNAGEFCHAIVAEQFEQGQEFTVCVLGTAPRLVALEPARIEPKDAPFITRDVKANHVERFGVHWDSPNADMALLQQVAQTCHAATGADCITRTDLIVTNRGPVVLEVNANPVLNPWSPISRAAERAGMAYTQVLTLWLALSWQREGMFSGLRCPRPYEGRKPTD